MSIIPTPYAVAHISRQVDKSLPKNAHGNYPTPSLAPVIRYAQSFTQGVSKQEFTNETNVGDQNTLNMAVPDPTVYKSGDQVLLFGQVVDDEYDGGTAFVVDGDPSDSRLGPWREHLHNFGGVVKLRRVQ